MVHGEQACCAFLTFEIREEGGGVRATIEASESARETAETVFELFGFKPASQAGCGRCGPGL